MKSFIDNFKPINFSPVRWTKNMVTFCKSKIFSIRIGTPTPIVNLKRWFLIHKNQTEYINEKMIIGKYCTWLETYGYKGYGEVILFPKSLETVTYELQAATEKVKELENYQEDLKNIEFRYVPPQHVENLLSEYKQLILSYKTFQIPQLKLELEEIKTTQAAKIDRVVSLDEVIGNKVSEIREKYIAEIEVLQHEYKTQLHDVKETQRKNAEDHMKDITGFQETFTRLTDTNKKLQTVIDQQILDIKRLENNSAYIVAKNQLEAEKIKATTTFVEKEGLSHHNKELTKENMDLKTSLKLKQLEINKEKKDHEETIKKYKELQQNMEALALEYNTKYHEQTLHITKLDTELAKMTALVKEKEETIFVLNTDISKQKSLSHISHYMQAEKSMVQTIKKMESLLKLNKETIAVTVNDIIKKNNNYNHKLELEADLCEKKTKLNDISSELETFITNRETFHNANMLQNHNVADLSKEEACIKTQKAALEDKISSINVDLQKANLQDEQMCLLLHEKTDSIAKNLAELNAKFSEVKLEFCKAMDSRPNNDLKTKVLNKPLKNNESNNSVTKTESLKSSQELPITSKSTNAIPRSALAQRFLTNPHNYRAFFADPQLQDNSAAPTTTTISNMPQVD